MKRIKGLLVLFLILNAAILSAVSFEGSITFLKSSHFDTTYYVCYVRGEKVRVEVTDKKHRIRDILLVNLENEEVYFINPAKKLYSKLNRKPSPISLNEDYMYIKTQNVKLINGEKCYQWRVKNTMKNIEVAYWVTQNDFDFFDKFVKVMSSTENCWEYFIHIPQSDGFFPMMSVERNLVREEKNRTMVMNINRKNLDIKMFLIPDDYKPFM